MIDGRYAIVSESCRVDAELLQEVTVLIPVDINLGGIGLLIVESARLADGLSQRQRLNVECNVGIESKDVLIERSKRGEARRFMGDENHVVRSDKDILAGVVDHAA